MNDYDGLIGLFWLIFYGCILFGAVRLVWKAMASGARGVQRIAEEQAQWRD